MNCKKNKLGIIIVSVGIVALIVVIAFLTGTKTASKDVIYIAPDQDEVERDPVNNANVKTYPKSEELISNKSDQYLQEDKPVENDPNFSYSFNSEDGNSNVFSGLLIYARNNSFEIEYNNNYEYGVFIESIKGVRNGDDGKYWQYYINGILGDVAADKKILKDEDLVEWRFEVIPF
jgi:hypothetical protein